MNRDLRISVPLIIGSAKKVDVYVLKMWPLLWYRKAHVLLALWIVNVISILVVRPESEVAISGPSFMLLFSYMMWAGCVMAEKQQPLLYKARVIDVLHLSLCWLSATVPVIMMFDFGAGIWIVLLAPFLTLFLLWASEGAGGGDPIGSGLAFTFSLAVVFFGIFFLIVKGLLGGHVWTIGFNITFISALLLYIYGQRRRNSLSLTNEKYASFLFGRNVRYILALMPVAVYIVIGSALGGTYLFEQLGYNDTFILLAFLFSVLAYGYIIKNMIQRFPLMIKGSFRPK